MKFVACYEEPPQERLLKYVENEHSFNMEPFESHYDYELALNKICLSVANAKIIQLSGFCGLSRSMNSDCKVPDSKYGSLRIKDDLKFGFAYGINETELPVFINLQTGWVCIGNPHAKGNAVEFVRNCVAVIDSNSELDSLWLKPDKLPDSLHDT